MALGRLNKQIAFDLGISEVTVKLHRGNVMKKMQATSVGDLIRAWEALPEAIREGRLPVPKYDSDFTRNETDGRRGRPNPFVRVNRLVKAPLVAIVDDDDDMRDALSDLLLVLGLSSRTFDRAEALLAEYQPGVFDCIITD